MPPHRFGLGRSPRVTVGQVYAALVADPWAQKQLEAVYQKLFEGEGTRQGSAPDYYAHVQPSKAKSEINALAEWAGEQFGQPGPMVPKKTPFTYISVPKWNGWITLFSVVAHGGDADLTRDFNETVTGMSWTSAGSSRDVAASGGPAPAAPPPPPPPRASVWSRVRGLLPAPRTPTVTGAAGSPPAPPAPPEPRPGILERVLGTTPRPPTAYTVPPIPVAAYASVPPGTERGEEEDEEERIARELERIKRHKDDRISVMHPIRKRMLRRARESPSDASIMERIDAQADERERKMARASRMLREKISEDAARESAPARVAYVEPAEEAEAEDVSTVERLRRPVGASGGAFG